jgi:hypothetical protein
VASHSPSQMRARVARLGYGIAFIAGAAVVLAVVLLLVKWGPDWLAAPHAPSAQRLAELSANRAALFTVAAGLIAVIGAVYTARTFGLTRHG